MTNRIIYRRQLCAVAFILSFTCKICMLPRYMAETAGRQGWIAVAFMMAIEMISFCFVYGVISRTSILDMRMHAAVRYPLFAFLFCVSMIKLVIVTAEALNYVSMSLFENGIWFFMLLAVLPVLMYMSYKGVNTIVRTSQIVIWFVVFALLFTVLLFSDVSKMNSVLPILPDGTEPVFDASQKHMFWFLDFTPLLFMSLSAKDSTKKWTVPATMLILYICVVVFQIMFIAVYGDAAPVINNAFAKIANFNYLSDVLGGVDFPIILSWIMMVIVKISALMYVAIESATVVVKKRPVAAIIVYVAVTAIVIFGVTSLERSYKLATSWVRYAAGVTEFVLPIILFIVVKVRDAKTSKK